MTINDLIAKLEQAKSSVGNVEVRLQHEEFIDWVSELDVTLLNLNKDGFDASDMFRPELGEDRPDPTAFTVKAVGISRC